MTTEHKHVLEIREQLPNWAKLSLTLPPKACQGHGESSLPNTGRKGSSENC